ncbi:MAG: phosphoribosylanthranilate isomerase [Candidatus Omnitrophica bacterium]|nr:phosphoribosylanthranilate isomerase [Candidatus Omnitrophota bacterium]MCM8777978.1 phosphoribosylanthranilate isomerase [Candidatus Omnitrophota bacterium]
MQIKICGFTRKKDIDEAVSLGIKIIGLNFYHKSPRYITTEKAKEILIGLDKNIKVIGVFVEPDEKYLFQITDALNLSGIQLHGDEPPSLVEKVKREFSEKIVIKALRVKDKKELEEGMKRYSPDFFLLDAYDVSIYGGTGIRISHSLLEGVYIPWEKVFLAGGITPNNIKDVLIKFHPYGIDVASGVESAPGIKDKNKIKLLLKNIKEMVENETS